jgi:hypothetical protein
MASVGNHSAHDVAGTTIAVRSGRHTGSGSVAINMIHRQWNVAAGRPKRYPCLRRANTPVALAALFIVVAVGICGCGGANRSEKTGSAADPVRNNERARVWEFSREFVKATPSYEAQYQYTGVSSVPSERVVVQTGDAFKVSDLSAGGFDVETFDLDGRLTSCSNATHKWVCARVGGVNALSPDTMLSPRRTLAVFSHAFGPAGLVSISGRTIAGVKLLCASARTTRLRETLCLSQDGVIGYISVAGGGKASTSILTKLTKSVAPGQFALPAPLSARPGV